MTADPFLDPMVMFLGACGVLALSIYTIAKCRAGSGAAPATVEELLFRGISPAYAVAGNLSAIFSVTYFSGAMFIYGYFFGAWCLLALAVVAILLPFFLWRVLEAMRDEGLVAQPRGNLLLALLQRRLSTRGFRRVLQVYVLIYGGLLVEELGVARLVIGSLFPGETVPTALLLTTVCVVVLVYLSYGGLRAALIADYEQLRVILLFVAVLGFYVARDFDPGGLQLGLTTPLAPGPLLLGFCASVLLLLAWFGSAVDLFARLRFAQGASNPYLAIRGVALTSVILLIGLMTAGVAFGLHLTRIIPAVVSPSQFTSAAISYFRSAGSPLLLGILLTTAFCMIFTTLNALLVALLHLGWHSNSRWLRRQQLGLVILVGLFFSTALSPDAVSAYGVFVASLMILPFLTIVRVVYRRAPPSDEDHLLPALFLAVAIFGLSFSTLKTDFKSHFLLPTIVASAYGGTFAVAVAGRFIVRRKRSSV